MSVAYVAIRHREEIILLNTRNMSTMERNTHVWNVTTRQLKIVFSFNTPRHSMKGKNSYAKIVTIRQLGRLISLNTTGKSMMEGRKFLRKECNYQAASRSNLVRHKAIVHEGIQFEFACRDCDYKATTKGSHQVSQLSDFGVIEILQGQTQRVAA